MGFGSMNRMFDGADDFDQNLGEWYVVANSTSILRSDVWNSGRDLRAKFNP